MHLKMSFNTFSQHYHLRKMIPHSATLEKHRPTSIAAGKIAWVRGIILMPASSTKQCILLRLHGARAQLSEV